MISSVNCVCGSDSASPMDAVRKISRSLKAIGARMVLRMVSAKAVMRAGSCSDIRIRPNWSPASRASVSCGFRMRVSRRASVSRMESPTAMPTESLTCLKRSRSITISVGRRFGMLLAEFAVGADHRARLQREPHEVAVRRAQAEILHQPAAALVEHAVQRGAEAILVERVQHLQPFCGRTFQRAALQPEQAFGFRAGEYLVG